MSSGASPCGKRPRTSSASLNSGAGDVFGPVKREPVAVIATAFKLPERLQWYAAQAAETLESRQVLNLWLRVMHFAQRKTGSQ